jgi:hypothetical protein
MSVAPAANVTLGTAGNYVILAKTGITTTGTTTITGDIAAEVSTSMTGFGLIMNTGNNYSTSTLINGNAYASDYVGTTPADRLTDAVLHMITAYDDAAGRPNENADRKNLGSGLLDGVTLTPGVYTWTSTVAINGDISFDGTASDIFVIQMKQTLNLAANKKVILLNGVKAENIYWQVAGAVTLGADAHMQGTLLAGTSVTFITGSTLTGRVLAQTACALQSATITA